MKLDIVLEARQGNQQKILVPPFNLNIEIAMLTVSDRVGFQFMKKLNKLEAIYHNYDRRMR